MGGGYIGVDVFFVLSGFLITQLLIKGAGQGGYRSIFDFYARRARRILPAAALTLVVTDLVSVSLLNFVRAKQVLQDSIPAALFAANFHFASIGTNYFAQSQPPSPIQHFWTLAVEEQFYVVWPILLLLLVLGFSVRRAHARGGGVTIDGVRRLEVTILTIVAVSLGWSIYYTNSHPTTAYFSTFTRAWELGLGAMLAITAERLARLPPPARSVLGWAGICAIVAAAVTFTAGTPFPGAAALVPTVGAGLVITAGLGKTHARLAPRSLLSLWPFRFVGDRSYAFYLWHWPVLIIALQYEGHGLPLGTKLFLLSGAFLLSILSYGFYENPLRQLHWKRSAYALVLWPVSVCAVLIVAGWGIDRSNEQATRLASLGAPLYPGYGSQPTQGDSLGQELLTTSPTGGSLPAVTAAARAAKMGASIPSALTPPVSSLLADHYNYPPGCTAETGQSNSTVCSLGDPTARRSIVLMGDSHAQMIMPAVLALAQSERWSVHPLGKSACVPLEWWHIQSTTPDCRAWYSWALREVRSIHPAVTIFAASFNGLSTAPSQAAVGLTSMLKSITARTGKALVLGDVPNNPAQPVDCLLAEGATLRKCSFSESPAQVDLNSVLSDATASVGGSYIDTTPWFCFENTCPMVVGHTIVYVNPGHITQTYAAELAPAFKAAFDQAVTSRRT